MSIFALIPEIEPNIGNTEVLESNNKKSFCQDPKIEIGITDVKGTIEATFLSRDTAVDEAQWWSFQ